MTPSAVTDGAATSGAAFDTATGSAATSSTAMSGTVLGTVLRIAEVRRETAEAVTIRFEVPAEAADRFAHRAGQFLTLQVPLPDGPAARCYSISSAPGCGLAVTVKAVPDGRASRFLVQHAESGQALRSLEPSGLFCPGDPDSDLLLVGAGSGLTPLVAILEWALAAGRGRITLVRSDRSPAEGLFVERIDRLEAAHPDRLRVIRRWTATEGRLDPGAVAALVEASPADVYVCGPDGFTAALRQAFLDAGVPHERVHTEDFASLEGDPFVLDEASTGAATMPVEVSLDGVEHVLDWPVDRGLVDVLLSAGVRTPYSCREGECGSCLAKLRTGRVELGRTDALEPEDIEDGYILACQARPLEGPLSVEF